VYPFVRDPPIIIYAVQVDFVTAEGRNPYVTFILHSTQSQLYGTPIHLDLSYHDLGSRNISHLWYAFTVSSFHVTPRNVVEVVTHYTDFEKQCNSVKHILWLPVE